MIVLFADTGKGALSDKIAYALSEYHKRHATRPDLIWARSDELGTITEVAGIPVEPNTSGLILNPHYFAFRVADVADSAPVVASVDDVRQASLF